LEVYPDQIELHRRILEISRKGFPERGAIAAAQLARIFTDQGDHETASKYYAIASAKGSMEELPLPPAPPSKKVEEPLPPPPALPEVPEAGTTREFTIPVIASEEPTAAETAAPPPSPEPASFELTPPEASSEPPDAPLPPPPAALAEEPLEMDLSGDLAAMSSLGFQAPAASVPEPLLPPPVDMPAPLEIPVLPEEPAAAPIIVQEAAPVMEAPAESPTEPPAAAPLESPTEVPELLPAAVEEVIPADFEDSRIEVEFYLENGFIDEARQSVALLEEKYPGSSFVAELRQRLDDRAGEAPPAEPQTQVAPEDKRVVAEPLAEAELADEARLAEQPASAVPAEEAVAELPIEIVPSEPEVASPPEPAPVEEESAPEEWELPTSYADTPQPEPATDLVVPPPAMVPEAPPQVAEFATPPPVHEPAAEESAAVGSGGMDILGDLAVDFASSIDGLATSADAMQAALGASPTAAATPPSDPTQGVAQLHGLLAEMEEPGAAAAAKGDPETHYNLGVAFREMGLLDEAIGEFQKVVKGAGKGNLPTNFLQACSLLAICFMDKKMPAIAVKWYLRALETPALDEEALMALQYDLGLAYEQAGDSHSALERFIEVYSQNIDFRDVAEKIRELQQKA
jgi:tetratricopeptide (TPR) repeat protein